MVHERLMNFPDASFEEVADGIWVYTPLNGPNSGVIRGDDELLVVDGQPNAAAASDLASNIAALGLGEVAWVALTHFHASRWAHLDVFPKAQVITSRKCRTEMLHRGAGELAVAHLRDGVDLSVGGITQPPVSRLAFKTGLSAFLGARKVELLHFGRGHTSGDIVVWVQDAGVLFTGDLLECGVTPFIGDASAPDWIRTLDRLTPYRARVTIPGRGGVVTGGDASLTSIATQRSFIEDLWSLGAKATSVAGDLATVIKALHENAPPSLRAQPLWRERLPFAAARLMDVSHGVSIPRIWTADRVREAVAAHKTAFPY